MESEFAVALSTRDGSRVWSANLGKVGNPKEDPNYPGARSTPTVDGGYVYALGSDGDLVCLASRTGKVKWRKQLRTDFGGKPGEWAYAESVLIDGDKLVCNGRFLAQGAGTSGTFECRQSLGLGFYS